MITSGELNDQEIAQIAQSTDRTIQRHRANLTCFGSTTAPHNRWGRRSSMASPMLAALCEHLLEKPDKDLDDMVLFIWDEFGVLLTRWSIRKALSSANWLLKVMRRIAKGRNADLRDYYAHLVSNIPSCCRVYVDKSRYNKRISFCRRGWAPHGMTPEKIAQFQRGQRYQVLPAYDQGGVIYFQVFQGSTDAIFFLEFLKHLLQHYNAFPGKAISHNNGQRVISQRSRNRDNLRAYRRQADVLTHLFI